MRGVLSSLIAFLAAGARPRTSFAKAIVIVLAIKLVGIAGIKIFMFPQSAQPTINAATMERMIGLSVRLP
ncbi:MAG TPA: hypothetical protein VLJ17_15810 [Xanthobacteraceae bacterium]|nr:hypothetical protein [Xanthobacteraceae bacterium]